MIRSDFEGTPLGRKLGWFATIGTLQVADVLSTVPLWQQEQNPIVKSIMWAPYGVYWWWVVKIPPLMILYLVLVYPYSRRGKQWRDAILGLLVVLYIVVVLNNLSHYSW